MAKRLLLNVAFFFITILPALIVSIFITKYVCLPLKPIFKDLPFSLAEENIQSRSRGNILMAIANKFGHVLLNTSNKSELAVGYGTLYGDMCGGLSVIGDLYKTEVFELCRYINRNSEIIPTNIITKPPSAELRPNWPQAPHKRSRSDAASGPWTRFRVIQGRLIILYASQTDSPAVHQTDESLSSFG